MLTSIAPPSSIPSSIEPFIHSAILGLAKPDNVASGSSCAFASMCNRLLASASAISSAYFGTITQLALIHERPEFAEIDRTMSSKWSRQLSISSSPNIIFDLPAP